MQCRARGHPVQAGHPEYDAASYMRLASQAAMPGRRYQYSVQLNEGTVTLIRECIAE